MKKDNELDKLLDTGEPLSNVGHICPDCAEDRRIKWQEDHKDTVIQPGDAIKCKFIDESVKAKEHMWVRVTAVSEDLKLITGVLDNAPFLVTNLKLGQIVTVRRDQVEQHLTT